MNNEKIYELQLEFIHNIVPIILQNFYSEIKLHKQRFDTSKIFNVVNNMVLFIMESNSKIEELEDKIRIHFQFQIYGYVKRLNFVLDINK